MITPALSLDKVVAADMCFGQLLVHGDTDSDKRAADLKYHSI